MFSASLYFDTDRNLPQLLLMLEPLLCGWIGDDYMQYYRADIDYFSYRLEDGPCLIILQRNACYGQGIYDNDRFRYSLEIIDSKDKHSREENLARMAAALEMFWANGMPTCTPGKADDLPNAGGEDGPIPWPPEP